MKRVLWISRHQMTEFQQKDLARLLEDEVELVTWKDTVTDLAELMPELHRADAVAAVLPVRLLAELVAAAGETPVFQSWAARTPTGRILELADGRREAEMQFRHLGWEQILRLELETKRFV